MKMKSLICLKKTTLFLICFSYCYAQCNGPPLYILPNNNTGRLAFPESNLDPVTGAWRSEDFYPVSVTCTWILKAPPQHVLYLNVLFLNTEEKFDFVTLYSSEERKEVLMKFSGTLKKVWEGVTPGHTLVIDFVSDAYTTYHGFHFAFMFLPKACISGGVTITEPQLIALPPSNLQGILPGPKRPGFEAPEIGDGVPLLHEPSGPAMPRWVHVFSYPQGLNCTWHLDVAKSQLLKVDVLQFQTDADDVLQVWKIDGTELKPLLKFWDDQIPRRQIKSTAPLLLNFGSRIDERGSNSGFLLNVSYISRACKEVPDHRTLPDGVLGYPEHNVQGNEWKFDDVIFYGPDSCAWILEAPAGYTFNISILRLDTRVQDKLLIKDRDKRLFYEGGSLKETKILISDNNVVVIEFSPISETEKTGFLLQYGWILKDCRFNLPSSEGEVRSPFYPDVYRRPLQCTWTITPPPGHMTNLLVLRIRLDEGDFLQITNGEKTILYSQNTANTDLIEFDPSASVAVNFLSDNDNNKGYFLLKYDTFERGNCNFTLTTCGWTTIDPLQVWTLRAKQGMMVVEENTKRGTHLPRGYRTQLVSPEISPSESHKTMCLYLKYILMGQDAFKMIVSIKDKDALFEDSAMNTNNTLIKLQGAQGNTFLEATVNFTVSGPFYILITYERGYGPHYKVGIDEITASEDLCVSNLNDFALFSCDFLSSFCGWRNTNTDHRNWELERKGVAAFVDETLGYSWLRTQTTLWNQHADLLSPKLYLTDLQKQAETNSSMRLNLLYQVLSPLVELKLLIHTTNEDINGNGFFRAGSRNEVEIWGQGKVASSRVFHAKIPLNLNSLPASFEVVLRAVYVRTTQPHGDLLALSAGSGVLVHKIFLENERYPNTHGCSFEEGFCGWWVMSTGNSVWHIRDEDNGSFAAILSQGAFGDSSQMISPSLSASAERLLSFRYLIKDTIQCLKIGQMRSVASDDARSPTLNVIWEQCRGKGDNWLFECIDLPLVSTQYQLIIGSGTGTQTSKIQIDDIDIRAGHCPPPHGTESEAHGPQRVPVSKSSWECHPLGSLCGMTQPLPGSWDWTYFHLDGSNIQSDIYISGDSELHPPSASISERNSQYSLYDLALDPYLMEGMSQEQAANAKMSAYDHGPLADQFATEGHLALQSGNSQAGSRHQFTCPDGRVLEPSWVCDGVPDCEDKSDELACDCGEEGCGQIDDIDAPAALWFKGCRDGGFRCPSGILCSPHQCLVDVNGCLPKQFLCDGQPQCKAGEDEQSCGEYYQRSNKYAPQEEWMSDSPYPSLRFDPSYGSSRHGNVYESFRGTMNDGILIQGFSDRLQCSHGLLIPKTFVCDGRKDCPLDGLDEVGCSHCGPDDFLCPTSGLCLPKAVVCDGEESSPTCTDEHACKQCRPGLFACDVCIDSTKLCDGVWDCIEGEDELRCVEQLGQNATPVSNSNYTNSGHEPVTLEGATLYKCQELHFMCPNGRCIPTISVCDRKTDCINGEDEHNCLESSQDEELFIGARRSFALGRDPWAQFPSYLITPSFHQPEHTVGVFSFQYKLDTWIGASNITLSIELLNSQDSKTSLVPWSLWRQAGHKGKQWINAYVIIPEFEDITDYKLGFLLSGSGLSHRSEQIRISKLNFRSIPKEDVYQLGSEWSHCEFKNSWCGWSQAYTERGFSWVHATASPHTRRTGPITGFSEDASSGFIFADSLYGAEGNAADLLSPPLQFRANSQSICFRFAVFLYGGHIGELSVHVMQVTSSGVTFTDELFQISGERGQSWIPVNIQITDSLLRYGAAPFLIVVRATRGTGPEADIALDHVSFTQGLCNSDSELDFDVLFQPLTSSSESYIRFLKAGPSLTPFLPKVKTNEFSVEEETLDIVRNTTKIVDLCSSLESCTQCVSVPSGNCVWCGASHACFGALSPGARSCPQLQRVHHNTTDVVRSGAMWCPRMAPGQSTSVVVASDTLVSAAFPVTNIQASHTTSNWQCIFTLEITGEKGGDEISPSDQPLIKDDLSSKHDPSKKDTASENEDEELWRSLKQYALKKKSRKRVVKVSGEFQGTLYRSSSTNENAAEIGVGAVRCGDDETLIALPAGHQRANANVELRTPDGGILDNPEHVQLVVYRCPEIADTCESCINLNASFPCGWCSLSQTCTPHSQCTTGLWHSHSLTPSRVCTVHEDLNFIKDLLEAEDPEETDKLDEELFEEEPDLESEKDGKVGQKKAIENNMKKSLREDKGGRRSKDNYVSEEINEIKTGLKRLKEKHAKKKNKKANADAKQKTNGKGAAASYRRSEKLNKKAKGRGFLKVPTQNGVFVARDAWRLHTGRQYYVPATKKTLVNLGFVRHVTYGRLAEEKARTILMEGAWKKAAGFFIDLYEKSGQDPMTSVITTDKQAYEKMLSQLLPE